MEQMTLGQVQPPKKETRADQILSAFVKFNRDNPLVWRLFKKFTFDVMAAGVTKYSADAICHRIRWHTDIETTTKQKVKMSNNFTAYYARLFNLAYPKYEFFKTKKRTSQDRPGNNTDPVYFKTEEPENEDGTSYILIDLLKELHRFNNET